MSAIADNASVSSNLHTSVMLSAEFQRRLERYAMRRLGDCASAQDAVQATMEALLRAKVQFRGESSYLTYATGVLRHKIGDTLNERRRYVSLMEPGSPDNEEDADDQYFTAGDFTDPEQQAHSAALGRAIQSSLASLSPRSRQTFLMRERLGLEGEEIAAQMGLSMSNTWVLLCRARQQLRNSLLGQGYAPHNMGAQHV